MNRRKRPAAPKKRQHGSGLSREEFAVLWDHCATAKEVAVTLGRTTTSVCSSATQLRMKGVKLKKMPRGGAAQPAATPPAVINNILADKALAKEVLDAALRKLGRRRPEE